MREMHTTVDKSWDTIQRTGLCGSEQLEGRDEERRSGKTWKNLNVLGTAKVDFRFSFASTSSTRGSPLLLPARISS